MQSNHRRRKIGICKRFRLGHHQWQRTRQRAGLVGQFPTLRNERNERDEESRRTCRARAQAHTANTFISKRSRITTKQKEEEEEEEEEEAEKPQNLQQGPLVGCTCCPQLVLKPKQSTLRYAPWWSTPSIGVWGLWLTLFLFYVFVTLEYWTYWPWFFSVGMTAATPTKMSNDQDSVHRPNDMVFAEATEMYWNGFRSVAVVLSFYLIAQAFGTKNIVDDITSFRLNSSDVEGLMIEYYPESLRLYKSIYGSDPLLLASSIPPLDHTIEERNYTEIIMCAIMYNSIDNALTLNPLGDQGFIQTWRSWFKSPIVREQWPSSRPFYSDTTVRFIEQNCFPDSPMPQPSSWQLMTDNILQFVLVVVTILWVIITCVYWYVVLRAAASPSLSRPCDYDTYGLCWSGWSALLGPQSVDSPTRAYNLNPHHPSSLLLPTSSTTIMLFYHSSLGKLLDIYFKAMEAFYLGALVVLLAYDNNRRGTDSLLSFKAIDVSQIERGFLAHYPAGLLLYQQMYQENCRLQQLPAPTGPKWLLLNEQLELYTAICGILFQTIESALNLSATPDDAFVRTWRSWFHSCIVNEAWKYGKQFYLTTTIQFVDRNLVLSCSPCQGCITTGDRDCALGWSSSFLSHCESNEKYPPPPVIRPHCFCQEFQSYLHQHSIVLDSNNKAQVRADSSTQDAWVEERRNGQRHQSFCADAQLKTSSSPTSFPRVPTGNVSLVCSPRETAQKAAIASVVFPSLPKEDKKRINQSQDFGSKGRTNTSSLDLRLESPTLPIQICALQHQLNC